MTPRHMLMGLALAGAAALVVFGDNTPDNGVTQPAERHAPRTATAAVLPAAATTSGAAGGLPQISSAQPVVQAVVPVRNGKGAVPPAEVAILGLVPREQLVGEAGDAVLGGPEGVFGTRSWTPPPPPPAKPPPPPPPMAPPLPYTYLGKANSDGAWEVFLARGPERTLIVRDKMVLDGAYRVDAITPPVMKLTYLPLNQVQQLNIGVAE